MSVNLLNDELIMSRKTFQRIWSVIVIVMIAAMVLFTIVPYVF